ncbi:uncharacterized protein LOC114335821 [Diabrotica virgifera virgifera]|uniref:Uncharacterized protein LOC114335821 n=1 Tax=Diabrotica virgifera virgifera TaxID=50390 RepID=A0A6P7G4H2_DIAVI|nr:uncharacterized protein LOC114335821 [Diabrotica virgifera virgifera]
MVNICCVFNCANNSKNSKCNFYRFPIIAHKSEKRRRWIRAINRKNGDGSDWTPKPSDRICSAHFVGNKKSENELSPSYIPSIFPYIDGTISKVKHHRKKCCKHQQVVNRHARFIIRRYKGVCTKSNQNIASEYQDNKGADVIVNMREKQAKRETIDAVVDNKMEVSRILTAEKECQVTILNNTSDADEGKSFTCNRFMYIPDRCDAEVQTDIYEYKKIVKTNIVICWK